MNTMSLEGRLVRTEQPKEFRPGQLIVVKVYNSPTSWVYRYGLVYRTDQFSIHYYTGGYDEHGEFHTDYTGYCNAYLAVDAGDTYRLVFLKLLKGCKDEHLLVG